MDLKDLTNSFKDKEFVKEYFRHCEDGQAVTRKLYDDGVTLNSPTLIADLVHWLLEAEKNNDTSATNDVNAAKAKLAGLASTQKEKDKQEELANNQELVNVDEEATKAESTPPKKGLFGATA